MSQFGAGVYLMSSMADDDDGWTAPLVFAEHCNPNVDDFDAEISVAAYGRLETVELVPLAKAQRVAEMARQDARDHIVIVRSA